MFSGLPLCCQAIKKKKLKGFMETLNKKCALGSIFKNQDQLQLSFIIF